MALKIDRSKRLMVIIGISFSFFVAEISGKYSTSVANLGCQQIGKCNIELS
jgi:hypothetical protein